ncbi:MAG TPA: peptidylprolyl isomerase [Acidimicrobiales bacterium]|nr:peptidylprolyl isomerase [Acidimicrobiales bacterium]
MRRFLLPLALALLGALALGACDAQFSATAAKVDGTAVSQQSLNQALGATAADAAFRCIVEASSGSPSISGVGTGTYSSAYTAQVLTTLVNREVLHALVARLHLPTGSVAKPLATQVLGDVYAAPSGSSCASGASAIAALREPFRTQLVSYQQDEDALIAHAQGTDLTTAGLAAYVQSHPEAGTLDCVGAILASSKAASLQLAAKIAHGASFASVARSSSLDTTSGANGGSLGCLLPSELPAALASVVTALPLGTVSSPVSYSGYWVLFRVTSRPKASALQTAFSIVSNGYPRFQQELGTIVGKAQVEVDPAYGTWAKHSGIWQVAPPSGPADELLGNPSSVTPSTAASAAG